MGYTFHNVEKKNVLPKLKAKASSHNLHFVWPTPDDPRKDDGTVWMKVMGEWNPKK